jgi:tRNA(adenine34) deaminase
MFDDSYYMSIALNEATLAFEKEEVPIGALIVHQGEIVSTAHNLCESQHDPTAHAELLAIQQCAQTLGHKRAVSHVRWRDFKRKDSTSCLRMQGHKRWRGR